MFYLPSELCVSVGVPREAERQAALLAGMAVLGDVAMATLAVT